MVASAAYELLLNHQPLVSCRPRWSSAALFLLTPGRWLLLSGSQRCCGQLLHSTMMRQPFLLNPQLAPAPDLQQGTIRLSLSNSTPVSSFSCLPISLVCNDMRLPSSNIPLYRRCHRRVGRRAQLQHR